MIDVYKNMREDVDAHFGRWFSHAVLMAEKVVYGANQDRVFQRSLTNLYWEGNVAIHISF